MVAFYKTRYVPSYDPSSEALRETLGVTQVSLEEVDTRMRALWEDSKRYRRLKRDDKRLVATNVLAESHDLPVPLVYWYIFGGFAGTLIWEEVPEVWHGG